MKNYTYLNTLVSKKQLKQILAWSFTNYNSIQACFLADELKNLGFKYATQAGISISIEDLRVPLVKNLMLIKATKKIKDAERIFLRGQITDIERFQKIIDTWNITSEALKDEVVLYFKKYDPLNTVYMMAFSGARGNLSQVRQLVGMRGLMSDPSGQIMNLPIKKNFREGLTITDYLMSGYGARKGIVDTALKTANSGYLTRRLIDVAQDIIIREKDCLTPYSFLLSNLDSKYDSTNSFFNQLLGCLLHQPIYDQQTKDLLVTKNSQITSNLITTFQRKSINKISIRSPLTCSLYRSICQKCYGWDLSKENIVDLGQAVGIIAGQSIGEPGTQLTMRTFHTGGIFTSVTSQQLISPITGIVEFSKFLKTLTVRTNRGENVLLTENSGFLTIISNSKNSFQLELPKNTILFIKNNQYIKINTIIGQLVGKLKQTLTETKLMLSYMSGEVFMPRLNQKRNSTTINKLFWLLSGQVYQIPNKSFLNFYTDYKINKTNYIFRSKIINLRSGYIQIFNPSHLQSQKNIKIININQVLPNCILKKFYDSKSQLNYLLNCKNLIYKLNIKNEYSLIQESTNLIINFINLITNKFKTLTGGIIYYTQEQYRTKNYPDNKVFNFYKQIRHINYQTIVWLTEETYLSNCDNNDIDILNNNFIPQKFEILPNSFSNTAGVIKIVPKKNNIQEITIRSGSVYEVINLEDIQQFTNKIFYPGEFLLDYIHITQLSFIEIIDTSPVIKFLIRPFEIYEIPLSKSIKKIFGKQSTVNSIFKVKNLMHCQYISQQKIEENNSINLITNSINLIKTNYCNKSANLKLNIKYNFNNKLIKLITSQEVLLNQYIPSSLKYTNINLSLIVKNYQFVNGYSTLGYLQIVTDKLLELVKVKSKNSQTRQIFLISNDDCITISKNTLKNKIINRLSINTLDPSKTGKIIIDNGTILTIQKGRPYFFPNCKNDKILDKTILEYKFVLPNISNQRNYKAAINIHYYDIKSKVISNPIQHNKYFQFVFSKLIIKKQGKFYISGVPIFLREILVTRQKTIGNFLFNIKRLTLKNKTEIKKKKKKKKPFFKRLFFIQTTNLKPNKIKVSNNQKRNFASLILLKYPISQIGIHSITEDFLEKEVNIVYCKNGEFIENNQPIGLLNFEKEITGDIVQGLPRIEELLEARKKKKLSKRVPKNQKKSLLIRKTSLDPSFDFRKLGTTIKPNEKINPHNLLKIYFNYYAKPKMFLIHNQISQKFKLTNLYEASYRSFKKVQLLILNSVQSVYKSQGVSISNKHLEIVIKQMTSRVQITRAGDTPLLPHEVIDLYHIKYINQVIKFQNCQTATFVPLLLGITKAALNNPSFISAASFQETTRVLTKAAIEGRRDWLRGLKENIVIGQLIPSGTGYKTYSTFFENKVTKLEKNNLKSTSLKTFYLKR